MPMTKVKEFEEKRREEKGKERERLMKESIDRSLFLGLVRVDLLAVLFAVGVGVDVEGDKEDHVRRDDAKAKLIAPRVKGRAVAIENVMVIEGGEMKGIADHELDDLHESEVLFPRHFAVEEGEKIVIVHRDVDQRIQSFC